MKNVLSFNCVKIELLQATDVLFFRTSNLFQSFYFICGGYEKLNLSAYNRLFIKYLQIIWFSSAHCEHDKWKGSVNSDSDADGIETLDFYLVLFLFFLPTITLDFRRLML